MNQFNNKDVFRAYLPATGKGSNIRYKDVPSEELPSFEDIDKPHVKDVTGLLQTNALIVDADNFDDNGEPEQLIKGLLRSEVIDDILYDKKINTMIVETENKGDHFYFLNNNEDVKANHQNIKTAIGIPVDFKIGMNNGTAKIKGDGVFRKVIQETDKFVEIPKWLTPIKTDIDFTTLEAGDGRNQTLFSYILTLQSNGFSKEEARETLQIINDYVLPEPLDQSELDTIYRDESFSKPVFFDGNTFLANPFGNFLISKHNIKKINNRLHVYENGIYNADELKIKNAMLDELPTINQRQRNEVMDYIKIRTLSEINQVPSAPELILFRNGVLDIRTDELMEHSEKYIFTNRIPHDYNPNAYHKLADDTLNKIACGDVEIRMLLEEVIGYTFYRQNRFTKAFILTGIKSNGKSTYLEVIQNILGEENYSSLDLKEIGDRFKTAAMFGKLANVGDDISSEYINDTGTFKKLATGNAVNVELKGQDAFDFKSYAKMLFSANSIPRIGSGKDYQAVIKRLIIIPFNAKFSREDDDFDPYIDTKLAEQEALEYFIKIGVEGLKRIIQNDGFTYSKQVGKQVDQYKVTANPLLGFLEEQRDLEVDFDGLILDDKHTEYQEYCIREGLHAIGKPEFSKQIQQELGLLTKRKKIKELGRQVQIFYNPNAPT